MKTGKKSKAGFVASIVALLLFMTIGFLLLSMVYTGPVWVKFIVFLVYLLVVFFVIKYSRIFVSTIYEDEKKEK